jgi:hypothetical protein
MVFSSRASRPTKRDYTSDLGKRFLVHCGHLDDRDLLSHSQLVAIGFIKMRDIPIVELFNGC